mmetsp:Transcript_18628/g.41641  ORF Transcript_18628/g.41641 Transcript_18628/m.41641 type:complete len:92 (+) Transcript_18628:307-582(+)
MRYYVQHVLFRFPSSYTRSAASQLLMHSGTRNADASYFNLLTEVLDASPLPFDHVPKKGVVGHSLLLQIFQCRSAAERLLLCLSSKSTLRI